MTVVEMAGAERESVLSAGPKNKPFTILVATDGSDAAAAALVAAKLIEAKRVCRVHVLSVVEPVPLILPMADTLAVPSEVETERIEGMRRLVETQTREVDPRGRWSVGIRIGTPALAIGTVALESEADLVIVGLHRHGLIGRILGEETAMEIARAIDVPLLVASSEIRRLPRRVIVAMGLECAGPGRYADAISAVSDAGTVACVHVKPTAESVGIDWAALDSEYERAMQERFAEVERELAHAKLAGDLIVRNGDPTRELAQYALFARAELTVVGIRKNRGLLRTTGGKLASRLLRQVSSSVLILPEGDPNTPQ